MENNVKSNGDVIIYQSEDGATKINVIFYDFLEILRFIVNFD